jgi:hypothetical protein
MCFPESCTQHSDCGGGFGCKNRTGKCDLCYKEDDLCIGKPGERLECCNGECNPVTGMCQIREVENTTCKSNDDCTQGFGCLFRTGKCGLCHPIGERCTLPYDSLECCSSYCRIGVNADGSGVCADPRQFQPETTTQKLRRFWSPQVLETTTSNIFIPMIYRRRSGTTKSPSPSPTSTPSIWNEHLVSLMEPFMTDQLCTSHFNCGPKQDCLVKHNRCVTCQRLSSECNENSDCCTNNCQQTVILGYGVQMRCGLLLAYV